MKKFLTPVLLLALVIAVLPACKSTSRIISAGLQVELVSLERAADGSVTAAWRMVDPNVVSYLLSSTSHKIYLNGTYLGTITDREPLGVPAGGAADRTSKVKVADATAELVLTAAIAQGTASYRTDSQIIIRVYDETMEKASLTGSGTVRVSAK